MRTMRRFRHALGGLRHRWMVGLLVLLTVGPAVALANGGEDAAPNRSPRVTVPIGGVTVVLVSNGDRLYAFVDRVEDNEPVEGAALTVSRTGSRSPVTLTEASSGLFVAPFKRGGPVQDVFTVSLTSAHGSGERTVKLLYDDAPVAAARGGNRSFAGLLAIALVSGLIGAMGSMLALRWWIHRRRRAEAPPLVRAT